jgi:isopenicillin-N epimerase
VRELFALQPGLAFLNHGSFGACPRAVIEAWQALQWQSEAQPVAFHTWPRQQQMHRAARQALAGFVGADADDLVHAVNTTQALNVAIRSLGLAPGDEVVTTDHEYAALDKTWADVAAATGAVIRRAQVPLPLVSESAFSDTLVAAFTDRTRVLFLSHVTSPTALVLPLEHAVAEARRRGIVTVIDGAHAPGQVPLDLTALGADVYAGNCHKWMLAPKGAAFLHVRREMQHRIRPLVVSHGWEPGGDRPDARGPFGNSAFVDRLEVQGTRDSTAFFAVPAALAFLAAHEWPLVIARCRTLVQDTASRIGALTGLPALSAPEFCAPQMVSVELPPHDPVALHDRLLGEFGIEIPVPVWQGRTLLRLSVQGYTTEAECDRLVEALRRIFRL